MNTAPEQPQSGGKPQENKSTPPTSDTEQKNVQISQPHTERVEGPFEHSGETSGWTEAERKEKQEQEQS